ncbi:MAG: phosphomethylpyrimidine synthase ThiC [Candidatus Zixiibacteriota bacterium]
MTLLDKVKRGDNIQEIEIVAKKEGRTPEYIHEKFKEGKIVILKNNKRPREIVPLGVGEGLSTKVNANIGTSKDKNDIELELRKLDAAIEAGADTVMDLSTGGELYNIRDTIIKASPVPIGTVPIYDVSVRTVQKGKGMIHMTPDEIFEAIEDHGKQGVDFITVHCGVTMSIVEQIIAGERTMGIVSRGGSFLAEWIHYNERENPLYEQYDRLLDIARKYEMTLSLGDGLRPGCLADATDRLQIGELVVLAELVKRAQDAGVQVIVEGPGHIPLDEVEDNIRIQKEVTRGAPFYVLGPIVTDVAPGYDHITSAIGGAIAASAGADFLCYVTATEHLALPDEEAVAQGVYVTRIAAHSGDIVKKVPGAIEWDNNMAKARGDLNWVKQKELSLNPKLAEKIRGKSMPEDEDVCTMCGEFCAVKKIGEIRKK